MSPKDSDFLCSLSLFARSTVVSVPLILIGVRPRVNREKLSELLPPSLRGSMEVLESLGADGLFSGEDCFLFNNGLSIEGEEFFLVDVVGGCTFLASDGLDFGEDFEAEDVVPTFPSL